MLIQDTSVFFPMLFKAIKHQASQMSQQVIKENKKENQVTYMRYLHTDTGWAKVELI